jgi:uncharacterized membrane protein
VVLYVFAFLPWCKYGICEDSILVVDQVMLLAFDLILYAWKYSFLLGVSFFSCLVLFVSWTSVLMFLFIFIFSNWVGKCVDRKRMYRLLTW